MTPRQIAAIPYALILLALAAGVERVRHELETEGTEWPLLAAAYPVARPAEAPTEAVAVALEVAPSDPQVVHVAAAPIRSAAAFEPQPAPGTLRIVKPVLPADVAESEYRPLVGAGELRTAIRPARLPHGLRTTTLVPVRPSLALRPVPVDTTARGLTGS